MGHAVNASDPRAEPDRTAWLPDRNAGRRLDGQWRHIDGDAREPVGRPAPAGRQSPRADHRDDRDRHLERLVRGRRARVRDLVRRRRRDGQSDDRHRCLEGRPGLLARAASEPSPTSDRARPRSTWRGRSSRRCRSARRRSCCPPSRRPAAARAGSRCRPIRPSSAPTTGCSSRGSASIAWPPTSSSSSRPRPSASG